MKILYFCVEEDPKKEEPKKEEPKKEEPQLLDGDENFDDGPSNP